MSITAANAIFTLAIAGVFPTPVTLQGYAADDVFNTEPLETQQVQMGVDGHMSAGFVFVEVKQGITLQADSASNDVFDNWYLANQTAKDTFFATGVVILPGLGKKWSMNRGVLSTYPPMPDAKKILQPRRFGIIWESISPALT